MHVKKGKGTEEGGCSSSGNRYGNLRRDYVRTWLSIQAAHRKKKDYTRQLLFHKRGDGIRLIR